MAAKDEGVQLFGVWGSPMSKRVEIALKLKGVEYKYFEEDLANKSDLLLKYNPVHKKIPVLLHHGKPMAESLIIIEYIDETWKHNPILPKDPYERAIARFWAKFVDDKCMPALWKAYWSTEEQEREKGVEEAKEVLSTLENELQGKKFFGGESIGVVDIAALFLGFWLIPLQEAGGMELLSSEKFPKLVKWCEEFVSHPDVKEVLPPRDRILSFLKARLESTAAAA